jgi:hypothetical protein
MKIDFLYKRIITELERNTDKKIAAQEAYYHKYQPPRGVSATITLYAMRDLKGKERANILSINKIRT